MNKQITDVCKMGKGYDCCRYLVLGSSGFECVKGNPMAYTLDARAEAKTMTARGDNCEGKSIQELNSEDNEGEINSKEDQKT